MKARLLTIFILSIGFLISKTTFAQQISRPAFVSGLEKKGQMYIYWGWNASTYTKSDIHFTGSNYDFTLNNAVAKDRQSPFSWKTYFNPSLLTIPQYNFRFGYFIKDDISVSLGMDHMKYVFVADQSVNMTGNINVGSAKWDNNYNNTPIVASSDLLTFEHTDGLNYVSIGASKFWELYKSENWALEIDGLVGPDIGLMFPKTNATIFGSGADEVHLSGWGAAIKTGLHIVLLERILLQGEVKGGYINMPDVITRGNNREDRAAHSFWFLQGIYTFGAIFPINTKTKN